MIDRKCPRCGAPQPADAAQQPCPACMMQLGLESWKGQQTPATESLSPQSADAFSPPHPSDLTARLPGLEVVELLGCGGMGAVYKGRQTSLDRVVAIKLIRPDATESSSFTERFAREARALARLNHPNIVTVHDFGQVDGLCYLVMEYVEGASLRDLIEGGGLNPVEALKIVPSICEALQFAHNEGIVHRDIKPENILVDTRGRVKIADFGLAKLAENAAVSTLTATHQVMGTLRYMAPEQMEGSHSVDHRADIYSLGVVFYEMLTGQMPIGHFEPPSRKVQVDVRLDDVVLRSLAREPERRYQQVSEVKSDLEEIEITPSPAPHHEGGGGQVDPLPIMDDPEETLEDGSDPVENLKHAAYMMGFMGLHACWQLISGEGRVLSRIVRGDLAGLEPHDWITIAGPLVVIGALAMLTCRFRMLAFIGSIACLLLGLGNAHVVFRICSLVAGVWALSALTHSAVERAFEAKRASHASRNATHDSLIQWLVMLGLLIGGSWLMAMAMSSGGAQVAPPAGQPASGVDVESDGGAAEEVPSPKPAEDREIPAAEPTAPQESQGESTPDDDPRSAQ